MPPIVELKNLTKDYEIGFWRKRKVRALDGLSLSVDQGEIFGFLGANGAGKTTTLKILMRLIYAAARESSASTSAIVLLVQADLIQLLQDERRDRRNMRQKERSLLTTVAILNATLKSSKEEVAV